MIMTMIDKKYKSCVLFLNFFFSVRKEFVGVRVGWVCSIAH